MPYICALCGAGLNDAGEVERHFKLYHPEEHARVNMLRRKPLRPEAFCRALRRAGLLVNENGLRSQRTVHTCALCNRQLPTPLSVTVHFIIRHPTALPRRRATAKDVYYHLVRRGLVRSTPPDGVLNGNNSNNGCGEELLALLAAYLACHEGAVATVKPRQLAPMVLTVLPGSYATILATALSRLLRDLRGSITDARGRTWLLIRAERGWCGWRFLLTRI